MMQTFSTSINSQYANADDIWITNSFRVLSSMETYLLFLHVLSQNKISIIQKNNGVQSNLGSRSIRMYIYIKKYVTKNISVLMAKIIRECSNVKIIQMK